MIFGTPALDETHPNVTGFGKLVQLSHGTLVDTLLELVEEVVRVENFQLAPRWDLHDSGRIEVKRLIHVSRLDEDGRITETLGDHLGGCVIQMYTWRDNQIKRLGLLMCSQVVFFLGDFLERGDFIHV